MKKEGTINYTLLINENNQHGITYQPQLDNDIASLLMAGQVIDHRIQAIKDGKKGLTGKDKKNLASLMSKLSRAQSAITEMANGLCDYYEEYQIRMNTPQYQPPVEVK